MDSNNSNITTTSSPGGTDHFFPTSPTHFFDPLGHPTFLGPSPAPSWPPPPAEQTSHPAACSTGVGTNTTAAAAPGPTPCRPSKKRSRASRRAPTTVLTTDTSNFRAMVQEFTGIPAPPFASPASLHFPRSMFSPPPPPSSFLTKPGFANINFQPSASGTPINLQSLLHSQLLNLQPPQPAAAPVTVPSSGSELRLPGVIGQQQQQQQVDPAGMAAAASVVAEFRTEKGSEGGGRRGDGLLESWMCSSD